MSPRIAIPLLVGAALAAGCGTKCKTETPAQVESTPGAPCTNMAPGVAVTVNLQLCPTCNQTGATCAVDTSGVSAGQIGLDPTVEACTDSTSPCGGPTPTCLASLIPCQFTSPAAAGPYTMTVYDPTTGGPLTASFVVAAGGTSQSCSF
ncbi:MAG TPA: hypothetical protein VML50_13010 [Anaeromyxobacter sp.]|nr:hypothetical protein [Anaeromyxobacter sp.]